MASPDLVQAAIELCHGVVAHSIKEMAHCSRDTGRYHQGRKDVARAVLITLGEPVGATSEDEDS
jgi:hypothetical protein